MRSHSRPKAVADLQMRSSMNPRGLWSRTTWLAASDRKALDQDLASSRIIAGLSRRWSRSSRIFWSRAPSSASGETQERSSCGSSWRWVRKQRAPMSRIFAKRPCTTCGVDRFREERWRKIAHFPFFPFRVHPGGAHRFRPIHGAKSEASCSPDQWRGIDANQTQRLAEHGISKPFRMCEERCQASHGRRLGGPPCGVFDARPAILPVASTERARSVAGPTVHK